MPKEKESLRDFLSRVCKEYPGIFRVDESVAFCIVCNCSVLSKKNFGIKQHLNTEKHKRAAEKRAKMLYTRSQALVTNFNKTIQNEYAKDICKCFLEANIPLNKLSHSSVKSFLEKYTNKQQPSQSTIRQTVVPFLYQECIEKMIAISKNEYIWIAIDETSDEEHRFVANFIFGVMNANDLDNKRSYLFNVATVDSANATNISKFLIDSLNLLWPSGIQYNKVLLVVSDAAAYMIAAMDTMKVLFPKMLHLTCFAHGLHRIAEFVRKSFPEVNELISSTKAVFLKAPSRRQQFHEYFPDIPLPPSPCITRWGTWLQAVLYYCDNFDSIKSVLHKFNEDDAAAICTSKALFENEQIKADLAFIKCNFGMLIESIKKLETIGLELKDAICINESVRTALHSLNQDQYIQKFEAILRRNKNYDTLLEIHNVLYKGLTTSNLFVKNLTPAELVLYKFSPVTSCDVERSFSAYKMILTDRRRSFTFENLKQHLILYANENC